MDAGKWIQAVVILLVIIVIAYLAYRTYKLFKGLFSPAAKLINGAIKQVKGLIAEGVKIPGLVLSDLGKFLQADPAEHLLGNAIPLLEGKGFVIPGLSGSKLAIVNHLGAIQGYIPLTRTIPQAAKLFEQVPGAKQLKGVVAGAANPLIKTVGKLASAIIPNMSFGF